MVWPVPVHGWRMQHRLLRFGRGFRVLFDCRGVQAAQMVIEPGGHEGGPDNRHRAAEQWLFVASGTGLAVVEGRRMRLAAGSLLLVERGEAHEIRNTGRTPLKTLSFYAPPAYTAAGDERPAGRSPKRG